MINIFTVVAVFPDMDGVEKYRLHIGVFMHDAGNLRTTTSSVTKRIIARLFFVLSKV